MLANKSRTWVAGTMVLCLLLAVASWFLLIGPKRAQAADLEAQTVTVESQNQQIEARIEQLKVQFAELPQRQAELAAIRQAMPEDAALPTLVRDLDAIAEASGVTLMTLSPGTPVAVQTAPPAAPAAEDTDAETPADGAAAAATPAAPTDLLVSSRRRSSSSAASSRPTCSSRSCRRRCPGRSWCRP